MNNDPIFIGGLAHSGKTMMRLVLSSHPNIALTRRTYMWSHLYDRYGDLRHPENFERCLSAMLKNKHMKILNPDPDRIREEFWQGPPTYGRLFSLPPMHFAEKLGKSRWGDQQSLIERFADPIFSSYPRAKMIHMIRDPRDRYEASIATSNHRRGKAGWETARWRYSVNLAKRNVKKYPENYKIVLFETLIAHCEETIREVCAFIDEDFIPEMVTMENAIRFSDPGANRSNTLPRAPQNTQAISQREVSFIQKCAKGDMIDLGYSLKRMQLSLRDRFLLYLVDFPANLTATAAWDVLSGKQIA